MKKLLPGVATSVIAILLLTPPCRADKTSAVTTKPEDHTVSLDLRFTKKRPNAMQRVFSFLTMVRMASPPDSLSETDW